MPSMVIIGGSTPEAVTVADNTVQVREVSEFDKAVADGLAFSWSCVTKDWAAHDTLVGVEVTTQDYDLKIYEIHVTADTASQVVVHTSSGVTLAGTNALTGINLYRGQANCALASAYDDETGNGQQAAGYTGICHATRVAADGTTIIPFRGALIVPYDYTIGVDLTADTAAGNVTIIGYFVPAD